VGRYWQKIKKKNSNRYLGALKNRKADWAGNRTHRNKGQQSCRVMVCPKGAAKKRGGGGGRKSIDSRQTLVKFKQNTGAHRPIITRQSQKKWWDTQDEEKFDGDAKRETRQSVG